MRSGSSPPCHHSLSPSPPKAHIFDGFFLSLVSGLSQQVPKMMPFLPSPAGNFISPVNDTRSYFGAGLQRESKARQQFDWRRTTQRRGEEPGGWHSLASSSKVTARGLGGTFCYTSLPSLGFLFYSPGGKRGVGGSKPNMISPCPLFPFSPFPLLSSQ